MSLESILAWRVPRTQDLAERSLPFCTLRPHELRLYGGEPAFPVPLPLPVSVSVSVSIPVSIEVADFESQVEILTSTEHDIARDVSLPQPLLMQPSFQHKFDKTGEDGARGFAAEQTFALLAKRHGLTVFRAPQHVDTKYHVDFLAVDDATMSASYDALKNSYLSAIGAGKSQAAARAAFLSATCSAPSVRAMRVDVKALKPLEKHGGLQNSEMWLELHGTRKHDLGWLLAGHADVVAVHVWDEPGHEAFAMLNRARLAKFAIEKAATTLRAHSASDALYKHYTRRDHEDLMRVFLKDAFDAAGCGIWCENEAVVA